MRPLNLHSFRYSGLDTLTCVNKLSMDYLACKAAVAEALRSLAGKNFKDAACFSNVEARILFADDSVAVLSIDAQRPGLFTLPAGKISKRVLSSFCELLRARLKGSKLTDIKMPIPGERVIELIFDAPWPSKPGQSYRLILEVMGRHSNLILVGNDSRMIAPLKPVPENISRVRPIMPGHAWTPPPPRGGIPLEEAASTGFVERTSFDENTALTSAVSGLSPASARQAIAQVKNGLAPDLTSALADMLSRSDGASGHTYTLAGRTYLSSFPPVEADPDSVRTYSSFLEAAWSWRSTGGRTTPPDEESVRENLKNRLLAMREKLFRELEGIVKEESRCSQHDEYRIRAEAILNNLQTIPKGTRQITLPRPDQPDVALPVELNPSLSAQENANRIFSLARRLKRGLQEVAHQKTKLQFGLERIEKALKTLDAGDVSDAETILQMDGDHHSKPDRAAAKSGGPGRTRTHGGFRILVGKSALDNEKVTFSAAGPNDLWLHTRDYPGSHVVILTEKKKVPEEVIRHAAKLAARSSGAKNDTSPEVMVTERKWVRKIKGGKPGQVRVERFRTIRVRM